MKPASIFAIVLMGIGCHRGLSDVPPRNDASASGTRPSPSGTLSARPLGSTAAQSGFFEFLPAGYGTGISKPPLLVFFHGVGENGDGKDQLSRVLKHGPLKQVVDNRWPSVRRFVVLSPQHRPAPVDPAVGFDCPTAEEIHAFITFAVGHYDVDPHRVYLTGLSCGAIGSWSYLSAHMNEQVAAAVLVAGNGRPAWAAHGCALANALPIWGFHGDADTVVPPAGTIEPMNGLGACPRPPRHEEKLTVYPGVGHDSWTQTYAVADPANDIYAWLLRASR